MYYKDDARPHVNCLSFQVYRDINLFITNIYIYRQCRICRIETALKPQPKNTFRTRTRNARNRNGKGATTTKSRPFCSPRQDYSLYTRLGRRSLMTVKCV